MRLVTSTELVSILDSGDFDQLIGVVEALTLEVKGSEPYDFGLPSGRYELAKDVSAFANADGGHLLVGLETTKLADQPTDEITALSLLSASAFDVSKFRGIIRTYVWPQIIGLTVTWMPSQADSTRGLGVIFVPPQDDSMKLFLMTQTLEEGEVQKQIIVGVARRIGADNLPFTPHQIYDAIRQGRDTTLQRSARIEEKLDALLGRPGALTSSPVDRDRLLRERVNAIIES